jgi:hypothetical protein
VVDTRQVVVKIGLVTAWIVVRPIARRNEAIDALSPAEQVSTYRKEYKHAEVFSLGVDGSFVDDSGC